MIVYAIVVFLIAIAGVLISASNLGMYQTSVANSSIEKNNYNGELAIASLREQLAYLTASGTFAAPAPLTTSSGWSGLPTYISGRQHSSSGLPFLYCPFSSTVVASPSVDVALPDGSDYQVEVSNLSAYGGRAYVTGGNYQKDDLIAAVVSPVGAGGAMPSCQDITLSSGRYQVDGGQVWTLSQSDLTGSDVGSRLVASATAAATLANSPPGAGEVYSKSLSSLLSMVTTPGHPYQDIVLRLGGGDFLIDDPALLSSELLAGVDVTLMGDPAGSTVIKRTDGAPVAVNYPEASLTLVDVSIEGVLTLEDGETRLERVGVDHLVVDGGRLHARDLAVDGGGLAIEATGASMSFRDSLNVTGGIRVAGGSQAYFRDAATQLSSSSDQAIIDIVDSAMLVVEGGSLGLSNAASYTPYGLWVETANLSLQGVVIDFEGIFTDFIKNDGNVSVGSSTLRLDGDGVNAVLAGKGSVTSIVNSRVFEDGYSTNKPQIGIFEESQATLVKGKNSNFSSTITCWLGDMFETSTEGNSERTSKTLNTINNLSQFNCI